MKVIKLWRPVLKFILVSFVVIQTALAYRANSAEVVQQKIKAKTQFKNNHTQKEQKMNLKNVTLEHTQPSLGPHEKITTISLDIKGYEENFQKLLQETSINKSVSLNKYLEFLQKKNSAELEKINKMYNLGGLSATGRTISNLIFTFQDDSTERIHDIKKLSIDGYYKKEFESILIKNGFKHVSGSGGLPDDSESDIIVHQEKYDNSTSVDEGKINKK